MPPEISKPAEQQNDSSKELTEHLRASLEDNKIMEQEKQKLEQLAQKAREMAEKSKETADALRFAIRDVARERFISERKLLSLIWGNETVEKAFADQILNSPFAKFEELKGSGVPPVVLQCACEEFINDNRKLNTYKLKDVFKHHSQFQKEQFSEALLMSAVEISPYDATLFIKELKDQTLAQKLIVKLSQTSPAYAIQFLERIDEKDRKAVLAKTLAENPRLIFENGSQLEKQGYGDFLRQATLALADQSSYTLFKVFDEWKGREHPKGKRYLGDVLTVVYKTSTDSFFQNINLFEREPEAEKLIYEAALYTADQLPELVLKNLKKLEGRKDPEGKPYVNEIIARSAKTAAEIQQHVFFGNIEIIEKSIDKQSFRLLMHTAATNAALGDPKVALNNVRRFAEQEHDGKKYGTEVVKRASETAMVTQPEIVISNFVSISKVLGEDAALTMVEKIEEQNPEIVLRHFSTLEKTPDKARARKIFEAAAKRSPKATFASAKDIIRRPSKDLEGLIERSPQYVDDTLQSLVDKAPGAALLSYAGDELHSYPSGLLEKAIKLSANEDPFALLTFIQKSESRNIAVPEDTLKEAVSKAMQLDGLRLFQLYQQDKNRLSKFIPEKDVNAACVRDAKKKPLRFLDENRNTDLKVFETKDLHEITEAAIREDPFVYLQFYKEILALPRYSDLRELQETLQSYVKRVQEPMDKKERQKTIQEVIANVLENEDRLSAYSKGVDEFNKKTGLSLECKGVGSKPLGFVFINTFKGENAGQKSKNILPVCLLVSYSEMRALRSKDDVVKMLEAKYVEEQAKYKEQRDAWAKVYSRMDSGIKSFEPDARTAVLIEEIHGGELEKDVPAMLDLYEKKGAKPFAVCTNNISQWELQVNEQRKQHGKSVLEIRSGTERSKLETWRECLQKAVEDPKIDKVLIHYKAHGLEDGVTTAEGSKVSGTELAEALMTPFRAPDPSDPRNGKPLSSLIQVMIIPMTCHPGRQMDLMKYRLREMKAAKDISLFAPGNYEVTQGGDPDYNFNGFSIVAESTRDMGGKRAVFSYYLLQYFEMMEGIKDPEPPLGTMVHALHYASRMSEQDSSFRQKPIGHRISEEHSIDERVSKIEQGKFQAGQEQMLT